jgi:hypothetical protein
MCLQQVEMETAPSDPDAKKDKDYTLVFCRKQGCGQILLGMKKRGFGAGKW